jgi:hypothetical protein
MTDEHAKLTMEYVRLVSDLLKDGEISTGAHQRALLHILKRLGPPTAEEAADIGIAEDAA